MKTKIKHNLCVTKTKMNKRKIKKHLKLTYGNVRLACLNANVSKSQFYKWIEIDPIFASQIMKLYEGIESYTIVQIHDKIRIGDLAALVKLQKLSSKRVNNSH